MFLILHVYKVYEGCGFPIFEEVCLRICAKVLFSTGLLNRYFEQVSHFDTSVLVSSGSNDLLVRP